jgi:putative membrane protein
MMNILTHVVPVVSLIALNVPSVVGLAKTLKATRAMVLWIVLGVLAFVFEVFAIATGLPYGEFRYRAPVGPRLFDAPIFVGLGWIPLLLGCGWLGLRVTNRTSSAFFVALLALIFTDILLDPAAVAVGLWEYKTQPLMVYEVPIQNFFGWITTGSFGIGICLLFLRAIPQLSPWIASSWIMSLVCWTVIAALNSLYVCALVGLVLLAIAIATVKQ